MFDQTFLNQTGRTNRSWTVTAAFLAEFAVAGALILAPLVWTDVLPRAEFQTFLSAPAPPAPAVPPPAPVPVVQRARVAPRVFDQRTLTAPQRVREHVAMVQEDVQPLSSLSGAPDGPAIAIGGSLIPAISVPAPVAPPASPNPAATRKRDSYAADGGPLKVGGKVQSAKLIRQTLPLYPPIAKSARIQGSVILQAIIAKDGTVRDLQVISAASPLLVQAAKDAVTQWVYQPTLLNNEPVEVLTQVTVIFSLQ